MTVEDHAEVLQELLDGCRWRAEEAKVEVEESDQGLYEVSATTPEKLS